MLLSAGAPRHLGGWVAQPKVDGWRAQVVVERGQVVVWSRNGRRLDVPELDDLAAVGHAFRVDGELVVMDGTRGDFAALGDRMMRGSTSPHRAGFLAFDLLELDGVDLTGQRWIDRQEALRSLELRSSCIGTVPALTDVDEAWSRAQTDRGSAPSSGGDSRLILGVSRRC